jgi:hypothetical protein
VSECPQCGASFQPARPRQRFCASSCQIKDANRRRASSREGRRAGVRLSAPAPEAHKGANVVQIFGQSFVRVDGWLALGPMTEALAQSHADRINNHGQ